MWRCKKCKHNVYSKDAHFCSGCETAYPQTERIPINVPVTDKIARWYKRRRDDFKGRGGLKGYHNHIRQQSAVKHQRNPIGAGVELLAAMFSKIFGTKLRSARAK